MWFRDALREFFHKADLLLLGLFGVVLIYSATRYLGEAGSRFVPIQLAAICLGVVAYAVMSFVDIELFTERSWKWMLVFNVFLILLLLTPFGVGKEETGNNSWLDFPFLPVNIQPAEVAKIFFILVLAWQCARPNAVVTVVALYDRPQLLPLPEMYGKNLTFKTGGVDGCDSQEILDLIAAGKLDTTPLITHTVPLRDIAAAYDLFEHRRDGVIKVAVDCNMA